MAPTFRTEIPPDHLISPLVGHTGWERLRFYGAPIDCYPYDWEDECIRAEEQTFRDGPDDMPVVELYAAGIASHRMLNPLNGWTRDS